MVLSDEEIKYIQSFVQVISSIPECECVYVDSYFSEGRKKEIIDVIAIWNSNTNYNELLKGKEEKDFRRDKKKFDLIVKSYWDKIANGRLLFTQEDSWNYSLALMHTREWVAEKSLAEGVILFDRFGKKTENKAKAERFFGKPENAIEIENIEQLTRSEEEIASTTKRM